MRANFGFLDGRHAATNDSFTVSGYLTEPISVLL